MLVLSRQRDETIMIGDNIEITIVDIRGDKVRLGITAPATIPVHRKEVYDAIKRENSEASKVKMDDFTSLPRRRGKSTQHPAGRPGPHAIAAGARNGRCDEWPAPLRRRRCRQKIQRRERSRSRAPHSRRPDECNATQSASRKVCRMFQAADEPAITTKFIAKACTYTHQVRVAEPPVACR